MAGYDGFSMSNNAREAYRQGKAPLSKWTKYMILAQLREEYPELYPVAKQCRFEFLRERLLYSIEWHHTSSKYNCTDFYELYWEECERLTPEELRSDYAVWIAKHPGGEKKAAPRQHGTYHYRVWDSYLRTKHIRNAWVAKKLENVWVATEGNWLVAYDGRGKNAKVLTRRQLDGGAQPHFEPTPLPKKTNI